MAVLAGGGHAERFVVHERAAIPVPATLPWEQAGAIPENVTTAHDALFTQAGLTMGERLLVHGAAGGVGTAAVLLGALAGATVVATVRDEAKRAAVEALAPGVWAIPQDGFEQHGPFDVILELVGAPEPPGRPRGARHRRAHLGHRRRGGRQGRGEPARADGQARRGSWRPRCGPARSSRRPTPRGASRRTCSRPWRTAACGSRWIAPSRWPRPPRPTSTSPPAARSGRSCSWCDHRADDALSGRGGTGHARWGRWRRRSTRPSRVAAAWSCSSATRAWARRGWRARRRTRAKQRGHGEARRPLRPRRQPRPVPAAHGGVRDRVPRPVAAA